MYKNLQYVRKFASHACTVRKLTFTQLSVVMSKGGLSTADLQRGAKRLNHASVAAESKSTKDDTDLEAISSLGERESHVKLSDKCVCLISWVRLTVNLLLTEQLYRRHGGDLDEM